MHIRPFEIALIGFFAIAAIAGLFFLSTYKSPAEKESKQFGDSVEIWGTLEQKQIEDILFEQSRLNKSFEVVTYKEIDPRNFDRDLLNAIADGKSPDLVIMPHTLLVSYRSKLQMIPFETINERQFRDAYIDGADIFMRTDGIYGIPFAVDPLVMYWNRDIFSGGGLSLPPKTWETLMNETVPAITRIDDERIITQSTIAFGEYANVENAKEILSMLFLQSGSSLIDEEAGVYSVTLNKNSQDASLTPGDAVLPFYTQFATPKSKLYSWNRSMDSDRSAFLRGALALYFGKASERVRIEQENPNLNFDIAPVPQDVGVTVQRDYGDFYAFTIPRASKNMQGAYAVALALGNAETATAISKAYNFAPVRRELFTGNTGDSFTDIVYQSALIAHGWLDPEPNESEDIFKDMIERARAGQTRIRSIMLDAVEGLELLFK